MADEDEMARATSFTVSEDGKAVTITTFDGHVIPDIPMNIANDGPRLLDHVEDWRVTNQKRLPPTGIQAGMVSYADQPEPRGLVNLEPTPEDIEEGWTYQDQMERIYNKDPEQVAESRAGFRRDLARLPLRLGVNVGKDVQDIIEAGRFGFKHILPWMDQSESAWFGATEEEKRKIEKDATRETSKFWASVIPGIELSDL